MPDSELPKSVPLKERLLSVPADAVLRVDTPNALPGCFDTRSIPVGALCHAAAELVAATSAPEAADGALHPDTADLVSRFSAALADKLLCAQQKYGYSNGWRSPDWMDECRAHLLDHVAKGDPRDVAAYCAFLWHHGERTALPPGELAEARPPNGVVPAVPAAPPFEEWQREAERLMDKSATLAYAAGQNFLKTGAHTQESMTAQAKVQVELMKLMLRISRNHPGAAPARMLTIKKAPALKLWCSGCNKPTTWALTLDLWKANYAEKCPACGGEITMAQDVPAGVQGREIDGPRHGPRADGSQKPNDATAIPRAKAGSNDSPKGGA